MGNPISISRLLLAAFILVASMSACQAQPLPTKNAETTPTSAPTAQPTAVETRVEVASVSRSSPLAGKKWVLIAYGDALNPVVVEPNTRPTVVFGTDGTLSGNGSCNNFSGDFQTDDQNIRIGPLASSMMACEVGMDQEAAYLAALGSASSYELTRAGSPFRERLLINYDSGKVYTEQLVFDAALTLVDTPWVLTAYGNFDAPTLSEPGVVTTVSFDADGTLSGSGGCNRYSSSYSIQDGTLSISLPAATLRACATGMDQEHEFFKALQSAESYQIIDKSLEITYQEGTGKLRFSASHLPLENVRWALARIDGQPLPEGVQANVTFTQATEELDNQVNGSSGCNNFFGTYTLDEGNLSFPDPFGTTLMLCEDDAMQVEKDFLSRLENATNYEIALQSLTVWGDSGSLSFSADRYDLEGPKWTLIGLGTLDSIRTPVEGSVFTAVFERTPGMPSGQISGGTGCNEYTAAYYANLEELKVNLPQTTRQTCADGVMEEEQAFFLGLNAGWDYRIQGNELRILYGENQALIFEGANP